MTAPDERAVRAAFADAIRFYHEQADETIADHTADGEHPDRQTTAREYYRERGWSDETIDRLMLGWAPPDAPLAEHLLDRGHEPAAIRATGLLNKRDRPLWEGRYVFPYFDGGGRPAYAVARTTGGAGGGAAGYDGHPSDYLAGKYAKPNHTREDCPLSEPIYGQDTLTDDRLADGRPLLIAEGMPDAISAREHGYAVLSPITTRFRRKDRETLTRLVRESGAREVVVFQDTEPPSADLADAGEAARDGLGRLTLPRFSDGTLGAVDTTAYLADALADDGVRVRLAEPPAPASIKVDLDDYLQDFAPDGNLGPLHRSAKPARQHPAYPEVRPSEPDEQDAPGGAHGRRGDADGPAGAITPTGTADAADGAQSALFDLDMREVTGRSWGFRGKNPLGHHGGEEPWSENYFVLIKEHGVAFDHKYEVGYTPLTYLACKYGLRSAAAPNGPLTDAELFEIWLTARCDGLLPDGDDEEEADPDPIPRRALAHVAVEHGLCDADETRDDDGDVWLPTDVYTDALRVVREEYDVDPGRATLPEEPVGVLPGAAAYLSPPDLRRYLRRRGVSWPTTAEARDRLRETLLDALCAEGYEVIDAPTALGKSHLAATTDWRDPALQDATGGRPVVVLAETREQRDELKHMARDAGRDAKVLLGYAEACPVAAGLHDPGAVGDDDDREPVEIDGRPASEWFADAITDTGLPASVAHAVACDKHGGSLPCCPNDTRCRIETQWPDGGFTDDDGDPRYDVVIATHAFAHVPRLRTQTNLVYDEQPDYRLDAEHDRLRRAVTAYLQWLAGEIDPDPRDGYGDGDPTDRDTLLPRTYEELVTRARYTVPDDVARRYGLPNDREAVAAIRRHLGRTPPLEWFVDTPDAHTLAPALASAVFAALTDGYDSNGRASATVPYSPPRFDATASDEDEWNRVWVRVVVDDDHSIRSVRETPDLSLARSVVGLDAWPTPVKWRLNVHPGTTVRRVLDPEERRWWRLCERRLRVVQVGDATRPAGKDGRYFNADHARELLAELQDRHGDAFGAAGCPKGFEREIRRLMDDLGLRDGDARGPRTMHYGEERSRNDFADEDVGLVYGCIDPGDGHILDVLAEAGLDAEPETVDTDTGPVRAHGRGFVGPDADTAGAVLASVRETHVAQMVGRFGRNLATGGTDDTTVYVGTDALPDTMRDYTTPGVVWLAAPNQKQRALLQDLRDRHRGTTASAAAERVGCSREHARQVFRRLVQQDAATVRPRDGPHGADVFRWDAPADGLGASRFGAADLTPAEISNSDVWSTYTWELEVCTEFVGPSVAQTRLDTAGADTPAGPGAGDGPPPG